VFRIVRWYLLNNWGKPAQAPVSGAFFPQNIEMIREVDMSVNQDQIWSEFTTLPPEAQRLVMDFIAFLQTRYKPSSHDTSPATVPNLTDEIFVGIWRDREDMKDSSA
jgi:hypothetical protein